MKALSSLALALILVLAPAAELTAEEWGGITPGVSTLETVRGRYGAPSRTVRQKVESYDTVQWIYEGGRAPAGIRRMTVEFGMLTRARYRPSVVRYFVLEPKPRVFSRRAVLAGWGPPDLVQMKDGRRSFLYAGGLLVELDDTGEDSRSMVFSIPQRLPGRPSQ